MSTTVQLQEDYVGRPSRVSRRVSIRRIYRNVLNRILILQCRALIKADHDQLRWGVVGSSVLWPET